MRPELPRLSVVVPCHNRARYLDVHLRSLSWSAVPVSEFEVVVADDGSTDEVADVVRRWRAAGIDVRLIRLERAAGLRNNAVARNAGLAATRHPVVIQTDPDIVFASDVLAIARSMIAPGEFLSPSGYYPLTCESTRATAFAADAAPGGPAPYLDHAQGRPNQVLSPDGVGGLHGAFVCWRSDLVEAGGYDESFRFWGWEDRELLVTLADRGLVRRTMPDTEVVHLWHPPARGALARQALAARGLVSRAAWEVQMQRASAEYPRTRRSVRVDERPVAPEQVLDSTVFAQWPARPASAADALPLPWQLFFDAHRLEAAELLSIGHPALARSLLIEALARPWEQEGGTARGVDSASLTPARVSPELLRYERVALALGLLARCEARLGDQAGCDAALALLEALPCGRPAAAAVRIELALRSGDVAPAALEKDLAVKTGSTPLHSALAIDLALQDRRLDEAWSIASSTVETDRTGDFFDQIRIVEYVRLLVIEDAAPASHPVVLALEATAAAADATEFVFSAAMRSQRAGLDVAAVLLFRRFLSRRGRSEERLLAEASTGRRAAMAKIQERARLARRRRMGQAPYSRSNAATVCLQS